MDVGAFVPDYEYVTVYHMRDLIGGKKKVRT